MTETAFTPREIVSELDRYIIGQDAAKRAVAIALRNRWRRQQVPPCLLYTSDAADDPPCVDLGCRPLITT